MLRQPQARILPLFLATLVSSSFLLVASASAQLRAGGIDSITPAKGRKGDVVTIQGHGFGSRNVTVTVGGIPAQIIQATGSYVTFRVPDGVQPGLTQVVAVNPGFQSGSIQFRMLEGILLPGDPNTLLKNANLTLLAKGVGSDQILDTILLNRIEVRFQPDSTIAQVNNLLLQIDGGIVGVAKASTFVTVAIPQQPSIAAIQALVQMADGFPGVAFALLGQLPQDNQIFVSTDQVGNLMQHLLPARFPAAWNALPSGINTNGLCSIPPIPLLIADDFFAQPPTDVPPGVTISSFPAPAPPPANFTGEGEHGYYVALVAAAENVGANPFLPLGCLSLLPVQTAGQDTKATIDSIKAVMPAGKFIVNNSQSFASLCQGVLDTACVPPHDVLTPPVNRAAVALYWKEQTKDRWPDFLMVVAAGNDKSSPGAIIYPGMGDSRFNWFASIAELPDPLFNFVNGASLWNPTPPFDSAGFTSLLPTSSDFNLLQNATRAGGFTGPDSIADNVIVVGSASPQSSGSVLTQHVTGDQLGESVFSDSNPDVLAVGEGIFFPKNLIGTSFAAPQVAGLASYLWMLSPDLQSQRTGITKRAIVANARNRVVDAYATVLSLDAAALPTPSSAPIRKTILDVNQDAGFDEKDVDIFLQHFFVVAPDGTITRQAQPGTTADFSRFDLNGDGFTTAGARRERFDLDRVGSTQYGQTKYSTVSQTIEGQEIHFDETALTDLEILCYYAYSPMFQGDPDARKSLLAGRGGLSVQPAAAAIKVNQTQQLSATTSNNDPVSWSVTPGCGSIDQNGLFTASTAGTCTVTATDKNDSTLSGTASVTVTQASGTIALLARSCNSEALGIPFSGFFSTLLEPVKTCPTYPPYASANIDLSNGVSVYTYKVSYAEGLSASDIANNSVSQGTLDLLAEVDAPAIDISQIPTDPNGVRTIATTGLVFSVKDGGTYLLTVTGQLTNTNGLNRTSVSIGDRFIPWTGQAGTVQPFNVSLLVTTSVGLSLVADSGFTTAGVIQNGQIDQQRKGEVSLTFSFQKVQ